MKDLNIDFTLYGVPEDALACLKEREDDTTNSLRLLPLRNLPSMLSKLGVT